LKYDAVSWKAVATRTIVIRLRRLGGHNDPKVIELETEVINGPSKHTNHESPQNTVELLERNLTLPALLSNIQVGSGHKHDDLGDLHTAGDRLLCFQCIGKFADPENFISIQLKAVGLTDDRCPNRSQYLSDLGNNQQTRFKRPSKFADLENVISNHRKTVELTNDGHTCKPGYLSAIARLLIFYGLEI